jgi:hypothetical protein
MEEVKDHHIKFRRNTFEVSVQKEGKRICKCFKNREEAIAFRDSILNRVISEVEENWKPISDYPDYFISDLGRVKSYKQSKEKLLASSESEDGYYRVGLCKDGKVTLFAIHKLVATMFLPIEEGKTFIDHKDRNVKNNHLSNLRFVNLCEQNQNRGSKGTACGHHHINLHKGQYQVSLQRFHKRHHKCFKTLQEAIAYRDSILSQTSLQSSS